MIQKIENALENKIPFVIFNKPNAEISQAIIQKNNKTYFTADYSEKGFVFAPFNSDEKTLLIPFSNADKFSFTTTSKDLISESNFKDYSSESEKENHINLVQKGIDFIVNSDLKKVVLSRRELINVNDCDVFNIYQKLVANYPTAYVYCWYHPISGLWMGATPEVLLTVHNEQFSIMSLASTQEYNGSLDVSWNKKEIEEHQIVTDYIVSKLKANNLVVSEAYTVKAGNLIHLRADISGRISSSEFDLKNLIQVLHPTPAICGMPKEMAKDFILENEDYNREYYTGFLGEINDETIDLFVNLRCMKIEILHEVQNDSQKHQITLFIGGGITKDSNPTKEWEETVSKSKVMKKVL